MFTWRVLLQILGNNCILLRGEAGMSMSLLKGVFIILERYKLVSRLALPKCSFLFQTVQVKFCSSRLGERNATHHWAAWYLPETDTDTGMCVSPCQSKLLGMPSEHSSSC